MAKEKSLMDKLMDLFFKIPKCIKKVKLNRITFNLYENNAVGYEVDEKLITKFFTYVKLNDNRVFNSQTAKVKSYTSVDDSLFITYEENDILVKQIFKTFINATYFITNLEISDKLNNNIETNYIRVLDFAYPDVECNSLFLSLDQKMILTPYDNDMWVKYESTPLRPGRTSYEVTCIYNEDTLNGMLIGALDFDHFKNGIKCSDHDARCYYTLSGIADDGTHDIYPHGYISGKTISSPRFVCGYYNDIREALEEYGLLAMEGKYKNTWNGESIFGWNSYAAGCMTLEQWEEASNFISNNIYNFCDNNNVIYTNLDANFMLNKNKMKKIVDDMHKKGLKCGNYLSPALGMENMEFINPIKGTSGAKYKDIIMKKEDGSLYPKIDGGKPIDVTNPIFIKNLELQVKEILELGFDYIKVDFTSHAGVEGERFNKDIKTGREALYFFYESLNNFVNKYKGNKEIFIDFSISPLLPGGFSHARRCCCDAFGHHEDVKYVLNALNFGWWQNGSLYEFNDPDHTVLYESKMDRRDSTSFNEAKSRFNASIISGTVMLLSDNYGPFGNETKINNAKSRALDIANCNKINELASFKKAFRPYYLKSDTCNIYYLNYNNRNFIAVFNFNDYKNTFIINPYLVNVKDNGKLLDLRTDLETIYNKEINITLDAYDSVIYEVL